MADAVIRRAARALPLMLVMVLALLPVAQADAADALRDPMRPPVANVESAPADGTAPAPAADAAADGTETLPRLQSIRRPAAGGAPRALFGETWVGVGGRVGEWRVRAIRDDTVTLQSTREPRETQRVSLHQLEIRRMPGSL